MPDKKTVKNTKKEEKGDQSTEELKKSIDDLKGEVEQLRELVNLLVEIIVNMEQDDLPDFDPDVFPIDKYNQNNRFSM